MFSKISNMLGNAWDWGKTVIKPLKNTVSNGFETLRNGAMKAGKFVADNHEAIGSIMGGIGNLINSLPKVSLGPLLIIWLGANTSSIIVMSLLINTIVTLISIYNGLISTDEYKIKMFKTFKATKWQILFHLVIPHNKETIISSLKLNISMSLIGVIMGEFLVSKAGIGYLILYGTQVFNLNLVMSGIILIMFISFIIYLLINTLEK